jgi:predicted nucleotide-binding protein
MKHSHHHIFRIYQNRLVYDLMQQSKSYKIELQPANTMMCAMQEKTRIYALPMLKRIIFVIDGHNVVDTFRMESIWRVSVE